MNDKSLAGPYILEIPIQQEPVTDYPSVDYGDRLSVL